LNMDREIYSYEMLQETLPHGDAMFPLSVHEVTTLPDRSERIQCHWHREMEFFMVIQGSGMFQIDTEHIPFSEGDVFFVDSNLLHSVEVPEGEQMSFYAVVFDPVLLSGQIHDSIWQKYIAPVREGEIRFPYKIGKDGAAGMQVAAGLRKIADMYRRQSDGYELEIKIALLEIWKLLYLQSARNDSHRKGTNGRVELIKDIMTYMREHCTEDISVRALAGQNSMSPSQFCRFFHSMAHMTPVTYINSCRITESCRMLLNTDMTVSEIAMECGFDNISYFNRVFMKLMHRQPREYRRSIAKM
jgi:AraC-like DNA-binding protein/mannose-6-phosphate isomerase-like protein (cupin superfamily)